MWDLAILQQARARDLLRDAEQERLARAIPRKRLLLLLHTGILRKPHFRQIALRALRLAFAD
jgi:hypothetical protein